MEHELIMMFFVLVVDSSLTTFACLCYLTRFTLFKNYLEIGVLIEVLWCQSWKSYCREVSSVTACRILHEGCSYGCFRRGFTDIQYVYFIVRKCIRNNRSPWSEKTSMQAAHGVEPSRTSGCTRIPDNGMGYLTELMMVDKAFCQQDGVQMITL
ncbi:uncharacterized protein [Periplaneta americana]|uniref:uncharacterized protein isoform X1 n=1 Tax=Periplaneta americana TaxID=6978 RepID=UPI0037E84BF3